MFMSPHKALRLYLQENWNDLKLRPPTPKPSMEVHGLIDTPTYDETQTVNKHHKH